MIGLTTGRQTSQRLNSLLKDLANTIPGSKVIRRGKSSLNELTARLLEEGVSHALALYRWHAVPGRIDFFRVESTGLSQLPPSLLISRVRLRREYRHIGKHTARGITYEREISKGTETFMQRLSEVLELPRVESLRETRLTTTIHIRGKANGSIELAVTSPPGAREVGPTLTIKKLLWDLDDSEKKA